MASTRRNRLAARVAGALAEAGEVDPGTLDMLLTDCAAEALSVRARILRGSRRLDELLGEASREARASEEAQTLVARNERAWEDWQELSELIGELRARRRAAGAGARPGRPAAERD